MGWLWDLYGLTGACHSGGSLGKDPCAAQAQMGGCCLGVQDAVRSQLKWW